MRKLLLIAMLALSTLAWAKGKDHLNSQSSGNDWYNQRLSVAVNDQIRFNQTVSPSQNAFTEHENFTGPQPGSMAANTRGGDDWYNQKIAIAAEVNRRDLTAHKQRQL